MTLDKTPISTGSPSTDELLDGGLHSGMERPPRLPVSEYHGRILRATEDTK